MDKNESVCCAGSEPCTEGKLLALHTAIVCLARTLSLSGHLKNDLFNTQLDNGLEWLRQQDQYHAAQALESLLPMLRQG